MRNIKKQGLTLIELMVVVSIFMLFLLAFYAVMEVGLKSWKIGEVRSDIQSTGETVIKRLISELQNGNSIALNAFTPSDPNDPNAYICFETPVYDGEFQSDPNSGDPIWQGFVIYYTVKDNSDNYFNTKILYRRYIPHNISSPYKTTGKTVASLLPNIESKLVTSLTGTEVTQGQTLKRVCGRISYVKFKQVGSIVNIELSFIENFRQSKDARVSFSQDGNFKTGTEKFILRNSVKPKN
jgi:prepilin-type N-terminal cleavage/methylation domain-containing protein